MKKSIQLPRRQAALPDQGNQLLNTKQINALWQSTPEKFTHERTGRGGKDVVWKYVTGSYVRSQLDRIFAYNWSFEVKSFAKEGDQVIVHGRLTGYLPYRDAANNLMFHAVVKEDFGRAEVKKKRDKTGDLDLGNEYKAATTDALKRCANQFGIARDIYSGGEIAQIEFIDEEMVKDPAAEKKVDELDKDVDARLEAQGESYEP